MTMTRRTGALVAAAAAALAGILAGCGSTGITLGATTTGSTATSTTAAASSTTTATTAKAATAASLPAGWKTLTGASASIGAPAAWVDVKPLLTDPTARAKFEQAFKDQSASAYLDALAPQVLASIDILAVDGTTLISGSPTNVSIAVQPTPLVKDLATLEALLPGQISAVGGTVKTTQRQTLGGNELLVVDYTVKTAKGDATGRQYDRIVNGELIAVSFTALPDKADTKLWDQMAGTAKRI